MLTGRSILCLLALSSWHTACSFSKKDVEGPTQLVTIERPSRPELGQLAVDSEGKYIYWFPGDASKPAQRGELTAQQLDGVRLATSEGAEQALIICAAEDFERCANEQSGYVIDLGGAWCWVAEDVLESCEAATHFVVLTDLLESMASEVTE
jgi:hypothetical protein